MKTLLAFATSRDKGVGRPHARSASIQLQRRVPSARRPEQRTVSTRTNWAQPLECFAMMQQSRRESITGRRAVASGGMMRTS
jgi:hypothetical protein